MRNRLFHYTIGQYIDGITKGGVIKLAEEMVESTVRAVVWCSYRQDWEPVCNKFLQDRDGRIRPTTRAETETLGGGLYRIEVDESAVPYSWGDYKKMSRDSRQMIRSMEKAARMQGSNVAQYRCSLEPIPDALWLVIERRGPGGVWTPVEMMTSPSNGKA